MSATMTAERLSVTNPVGPELTTPEQVLADATLKEAKAQTRLDYAIAMVKRGLRKAGEVAVAIWNRVKAFALKYSSFAAIGSGIVMATKAGWRAVASGVTNAVGWVAKAAVTSVGWLSKFGHWLGKGVSNVVGFFNKGAGAKVAEWNDRAYNWVGEKLESAKQRIDIGVHMAKAVLTADSTTSVVNVGSGIMAGAVAANVVSGGSIALSAAGIPAIGGTLAAIVMGTPLFFLGLLGLIGGAVAYTLTFKRDTVNLNAEAEAEAAAEMAEAVAEAEVIIENAEVMEMTADALVEAARQGAQGKHNAQKQSGKGSK